MVRDPKIVQYVEELDLLIIRDGEKLYHITGDVIAGMWKAYAEGHGIDYDICEGCECVDPETVVPLEDYRSMEQTVYKLTQALAEAETVNNGRKSRIITNADNLRSIQNDMQLAIFMGSVNACPYDRDDALFECEKWNGACDRCWLYWLKQEVEGDGTETLDEVEE